MTLHAIQTNTSLPTSGDVAIGVAGRAASDRQALRNDDTAPVGSKR